MKDGSEAIGVGEIKRIKTPGIVVSLHGNKLLVSFHYFPCDWQCVKELYQVVI